MSFQNLKDRNSHRFSEVSIFLNEIILSEPDTATPQSKLLRIQKGLFYVHLYSALEGGFNDIVQTSILEVNRKAAKLKHYNPRFHNVVSFNRMKSFKQCSNKKYLERSIAVFENLEAPNIQSIDETLFADTLQNVWPKTIDEVMKAFGLKGFSVTTSTSGLLKSLTDNRNAIAHGRKSAAEVGERVRAEHLLRLHEVTVQSLANVSDEFEVSIIANKFLKPSARRYY